MTEQEASGHPGRGRRGSVGKAGKRRRLALASLGLGCVLLWALTVLWVWPLAPPWPRLRVDFCCLLLEGPCVRRLPLGIRLSDHLRVLQASCKQTRGPGCPRPQVILAW